MRPVLWPLVAPILGILALVLYLVGAGGPIRAVVSFAFLAFGPGIALVRLLGPLNLTATLTLALAVSLAIDTVISGTLAYSGHWSPGAGLALAFGIALLGAALDVGLRARRESSPS